MTPNDHTEPIPPRAAEVAARAAAPSTESAVAPESEPVREAVYRATSLEAAHAIGRQLYYPHRLEPRARVAHFGCAATSIQLGPMMLGSLHYSTPVRVDTPPYETSYQLNVPLRGAVRTAVGDRNVEATPTRAALYSHDVETAFSGFERPSVMLAVKLDRHEFERISRHLFQLDSDALPEVKTELDFSEGPGRAWIMLARRLARVARRGEGLNPTLAGHLAERMMTDLVVMSATLPGEDVPTFDAIGASALSIAIDVIEHTWGAPLSLETLAVLTGVSGRALQQAFRRAYDMTPMEYQLSVRLARVRADLAVGVPGIDRVADIARRHGFAHLGRFAAQYAREFGERPGDTLRR